MAQSSLRITVLTTSFPRFAGDESSVFVGRMVEAFSEAGLTGSVIVPYDCLEQEQETLGSFQVERYRYGIFQRGRLAFGAGIMPNLRKSPLLYLQIPAFLIVMFWRGWSRRGSTDVYQANWVVSGSVARLLSMLSGKPYIVTLRGEDVRLLRKGMLGAPFRWALKGACAVTSVNESFVEDVMSCCSIEREKLHFIPNGVSLIECSESEMEEAQKFRSQIECRTALIFVGTIIPRKQVHVLLDMLAHSRLSTYGLIVCGRTQDSQYYNLLCAEIEKKGLRGRVCFTGAVSPATVHALLRKADLYVSASSHEGRSNSVLEAQAAGLPCLVSDIPGHKEVIEHGVNGLLFSFDRTEEAVEGMQELLENGDSAGQMSKEARAYASKFTWNNTAELYLSLFKKCV